MENVAYITQHYSQGKRLVLLDISVIPCFAAAFPFMSIIPCLFPLLLSVFVVSISFFWTISEHMHFLIHPTHCYWVTQFMSSAQLLALCMLEKVIKSN